MAEEEANVPSEVPEAAEQAAPEPVPMSAVNFAEDVVAQPAEMSAETEVPNEAPLAESTAIGSSQLMHNVSKQTTGRSSVSVPKPETAESKVPDAREKLAKAPKSKCNGLQDMDDKKGMYYL